MTHDPAAPDPRTQRIRMLNDMLRKTPLDPSLGTFVITAAVDSFLKTQTGLPQTLPHERLLHLCQALADFQSFTPENDPYGEHDCAFFTVWDQKFFFKIDYYDAQGSFGSEDPADPLKTRRVLTVGFPQDW